MSKHTPGPWEVDMSFGSSGLIRWVNEPEYAVASVTGYYTSRGQTLGNARLIAAAPELLEALENLERTAGIAAVYHDPARVVARAAIAKAKGEQP